MALLLVVALAAPARAHGPGEVPQRRRSTPMVRAELHPKDMIHAGPEALRGWIRTTWLPILGKLPERDRSGFVDAVLDRYLEAHPPDARGRTHVAMVRLEIDAEAA